MERGFRQGKEKITAKKRTQRPLKKIARRGLQHTKKKQSQGKDPSTFYKQRPQGGEVASPEKVKSREVEE